MKNFKNMKIKIKRFSRLLKNKYITHLLTLLIGASVTLAFFPFQSEVQQYYWKKQFRNQLSIKGFEKRLELIADLHDSCVRLNFCTDDYGKSTLGPSDCYVSSINDIWRVGMVSTHFFGENVRLFLNNDFIDEYEMLHMRVIINPINSEGQYISFKESCDDLLSLMQDNLYEGLPWFDKK